MTGTARYMAPECHEESGTTDYTNKVDVFSFAIMAYELLARKRAYEENETLTMAQIARAVLTKGMRPKVPKSWSPEITGLLERAWAQEAQDRPTFAQLASEIEELLKNAEVFPGGAGKKYGIQGGAGACCLIM